MSMLNQVKRFLTTTDDDNHVNCEATEAFLNTIYLNFIIFCTLAVIFEFNRAHKAVYLKRFTRKLLLQGRVPQPPGWLPFAWVYELSKVSEDDLLRMVGLDGYMMIRYLNICIRISAFLTLCGLVILMPIYSKAAGSYKAWSKFTVANIKNDPSATELWVPVVFAYLFSAYYCRMMQQEYINFMHKRVDHLENGDDDTPTQTYFTVMVEHVPAVLRSNTHLSNFFNKLFPDKVYKAEVSLDLNELETLCAQRRQVRDRLEKADAIWHATLRRPTIWLSKSYYANDNTANSNKSLNSNIDAKSDQRTIEVNGSMRGRLRPAHEDIFADIFGYAVYDSIDHYSECLHDLNDRVKNLQDVYFKAQRRSSVNLDKRNATEGRLTKEATNVVNYVADQFSSFTKKTDNPVSTDISLLPPPPLPLLTPPRRSQRQEQRKTFNEDDLLLPKNQSQLHSPSKQSLMKIQTISTSPLRSTPIYSQNDSHRRIFNYTQAHQQSTNPSNVPRLSIDTTCANTKTEPTSNNLKSPDIFVNNTWIESNSSPPEQTNQPHNQIYQQQYEPPFHQLSTPSSSLRPITLTKSESNTKLSDSYYSAYWDDSNTPKNETAIINQSRLSNGANLNNGAFMDEIPPPSNQLSIRSNYSSPETKNSFNYNNIHDQLINENNDYNYNTWIDSPIPNYSSLSKSQIITKQRTLSELTMKIGTIGTNFVDVAGSSVQTFRREATVATTGALKGMLEATRTLELLTLGAAYINSSTAFITLKSRVAACCAHQMLLSHEHHSICVNLAPNPKDIIWENVSIPERQIAVRNIIAHTTLVIGAVFWSLVVGAITAITNLESLSGQYHWLQAYQSTSWFILLNNYLAVGFLLALLALLPVIFDSIARNYEGIKLESAIQNSIMDRLFYYQIANVFVGLGIGSISSSLNQIISNPTNILTILGGSLPRFSMYFATLIVTKTLTAIPIEMLRIWPLVQVVGLRMCFTKRTMTRRELMNGVLADEPILYGWLYPNILMVLIILFIYATISPMVSVFALAYFSYAYLMYKYQLLYVYVNKYQSGGYMWYAVFNRSMFSLIAGVVTLLCYLLIRKTFTSGPVYFLIPLPICIYLFWVRCIARYKPPTLCLSMESAIEIDKEAEFSRAQGLPTDLDSFKPTLFRQPSLTEGCIQPLSYRAMMPASTMSFTLDRDHENNTSRSSQHAGNETRQSQDAHEGMLYNDSSIDINDDSIDVRSPITPDQNNKRSASYNLFGKNRKSADSIKVNPVLNKSSTTSNYSHHSCNDNSGYQNGYQRNSGYIPLTTDNDSEGNGYLSRLRNFSLDDEDSEKHEDTSTELDMEVNKMLDSPLERYESVYTKGFE